MIEYLGHEREARAIEAAVQWAVAEGQGTRDIGGSLGTRAAGDYIEKLIRSSSSVRLQPDRPE
jgi:isocitrate/isopropylmalate dehydrogenase